MKTLLEGGAFFESPRWHEGRWWVSDFYRHLVLTVDTDGNAEEVLTVEGQPSGLGWLPDGDLLVVSMRDHRILRRSADGNVREHADLTKYCGGHLNDMVVSADGRAYVGNFGFDLMAFADPAPAVSPTIRVPPSGVITEPFGNSMSSATGVAVPSGSTRTSVAGAGSAKAIRSKPKLPTYARPSAETTMSFRCPPQYCERSACSLTLPSAERRRTR